MYDAIWAINSWHFVPVNNRGNKEFSIALGTQIRFVRQKKGLSMRDLALQAEMEYSQLSKIERGVINTTVSSLQSLAEALDVPIKDFFDFSFTPPKR